MRQLYKLFFGLLFFASFNANALLITDTYYVDRQIPINTWESTIFDLTPLGYSPTTDIITYIKLTYDFTEIYSPTNEGDEEDYNDPDYPMNGGPIYEDEPAILSSWLFNWRDYHPDIDTGLIVYERDWTRTDMCQLETFGIPGDDSSVYCLLNLDLYGNLNAGVLSQSNNIWLNSISVEVEFNRQSQVPEPSSVLLFGLGLFAVGLRYRKVQE